ncbi:MAG: DUF6384 family protein [Gammaproteobacteria bacterium]
MATANAASREAPLDEVMLAMDVVDTIRHQELIVERELRSGERREELLARLKSLYAAQGIDVPDHVLAAGVAALEEDRFTYAPPDSGFQRTLANWYVSRSRWGKPLLAVLALGLVIFAAWQFMVVRPEAARTAALPDQLESSYAAVLEATDVEAVEERAAGLLAEGEAAIGRGDTGAAQERIAELAALENTLRQSYDLHVVSRPGELSGVWRVPEANPGARNYYLIVEAIAEDGQPIPVPVRNEEDGQIATVRKWGLRVDKGIFDRFAEDKRDDGIIQDYVVGSKQRGELTPEYRIPTTGAAITSW